MRLRGRLDKLEQNKAKQSNAIYVWYEKDNGMFKNAEGETYDPPQVDQEGLHIMVHRV